VSAEGASAPALRIFSYLPNPRLAKATIAARLCGVELEVRGASPRELPGWLWDFDARPLAEGEGEAAAGTAREARTGFRGRLYKTEAFLEAHPFGTVPAAFSPDGSVGVFESNSILRAVARLGQERHNLYGADAYTASRIDSFLDTSLVFARDSQLYLLALASGRIDGEVYGRAEQALSTYLGGIDRALAPAREFLVGRDVTLADVCFATEVALFSAECVSTSRLAKARFEPLFGFAIRQRFPRALAHFDRLCAHEAFAPDLEPYLSKLREEARPNAGA
jgi:glutathione S-transferase